MKLDNRLRAAAYGFLRLAIAAVLLVVAPLAWSACDAGGIVTLTGGTTSDGAGGATASSSSSSSSSSSTGGQGGGPLACGPGGSLCADTCVNLQNDPDNCGACGVPCADGEVCSATHCGLTCVGQSTKCGALCVDIVNDPANCGACGAPCAASEVCQDSHCAVACLGGSSKCGDRCVDLVDDPANCGVCGVPCATGELCVASACCATLCAGVCEDLQTDRDHCGSCGVACAAIEVCTAGACAVAPVVVSTNPADGALGVALDRKVDATFSVPMDPLTIDATTFLVTDGATPIVGTVKYVGTTATFTPTAPYPMGALLTATITAGARDTSGNALVADFVWTFTTGALNGVATVDLGAAAPYAILAFNTVTNVNNPGTIVTGDLGISPGAALVGFPPGQVTGVIHAGDPAAALAEAAVLAAYNDAAGRLGAAVLPGDLTGLTFTPGVYKNSISVMLSSGSCTLDAQGDANAVFIFQMGTTLTTGPGTQIILSGGAKAANVFWAVGTSATLGTTSSFAGTVIAASAITMTTGASIEGRLLAQGAAVALDTNAVTVPSP